MRKKKNSKTFKKIKIILPIILVLILVGTVALIYIKNNNIHIGQQENKNISKENETSKEGSKADEIKIDEEQAKVLNGTYVYSEDTKYSFDGKKEGMLYCSAGEFKYIYVIDDAKLKLYFENENMKNATYVFSLTGDQLTLVGGAGTTGGTYELKKETN